MSGFDRFGGVTRQAVDKRPHQLEGKALVSGRGLPMSKSMPIQRAGLKPNMRHRLRRQLGNLVGDFAQRAASIIIGKAFGLPFTGRDTQGIGGTLGGAGTFKLNGQFVQGGDKNKNHHAAFRVMRLARIAGGLRVCGLVRELSSGSSLASWPSRSSLV